MTVTALDITSEYREIVDHLAELELQAGRLRKRRSELDLLAAQWMDEQGVDALKGDTLSLTRTERRVYSVDDWDQMLKWANDRGLFPFHRRLSDTVLAEIEATGGQLPDCVCPTTIHQIKYRSL